MEHVLSEVGSDSCVLVPLVNHPLTWFIFEDMVFELLDRLRDGKYYSGEALQNQVARIINRAGTKLVFGVCGNPNPLDTATKAFLLYKREEDGTYNVFTYSLHDEKDLEELAYRLSRYSDNHVFIDVGLDIPIGGSYMLTLLLRVDRERFLPNLLRSLSRVVLSGKPWIEWVVEQIRSGNLYVGVKSRIDKRIIFVTRINTTSNLTKAAIIIATKAKLSNTASENQPELVEKFLESVLEDMKKLSKIGEDATITELGNKYTYVAKLVEIPTKTQVKLLTLATPKVLQYKQEIRAIY